MGGDRQLIGAWAGCTDLRFLIYADDSTTDCWVAGVMDSGHNSISTTAITCPAASIVNVGTWQHVAFTYERNKFLYSWNKDTVFLIIIVHCSFYFFSRRNLRYIFCNFT